MKKLKFLIDIQDKYTGEKYKAGDIKEFKNERAEEILNAKRCDGSRYAELVIEEVETAVKKEDKENTSKKVKKK